MQPSINELKQEVEFYKNKADFWRKEHDAILRDRSRLKTAYLEQLKILKTACQYYASTPDALPAQKALRDLVYRPL